MEAQALQQQLIDANGKIANLTGTVAERKNKVEQQTKVWENAKADENEKKNMIAAVYSIKQFNAERVSSVNITADDVNTLFVAIDSFMNKLNSVNVSAEEQEKILNQYKAELKQSEDELQEIKDLKTSYQIQLRVAMKKKEDELAAMRKLLEESEQPVQADNQ